MDSYYPIPMVSEKDFTWHRSPLFTSGPWPWPKWLWIVKPLTRPDISLSLILDWVYYTPIGMVKTYRQFCLTLWRNRKISCEMCLAAGLTKRSRTKRGYTCESVGSPLSRNNLNDTWINRPIGLTLVTYQNIFFYDYWGPLMWYAPFLCFTVPVAHVTTEVLGMDPVPLVGRGYPYSTLLFYFSYILYSFFYLVC